jgi:hypothetical protein
MTAYALSGSSAATIHSVPRVNALLLALGAAGVVVTSLLYGASPPAAAMPLVPIDLAAATKGAVEGAATMHLAGLFGIFADVLITGSGLVLGANAFARGEEVPALGWFLIAISTVIFAVVDSLVGFVLSPVAAGAPAAFFAVKSLFDVLFMLGTATFGLGAILTMARDALAPGGATPRLLAIVACVVGLSGFVGGLGGTLGFNLHNLMAVGLLGGSASFTVIGLMLARR